MDDVVMVVLVEGESDRVALDALAGMCGRDLEHERVSLLPMHGAMNIRKHVERLGPHGLDVRLAGLCDANEEGYFRRAVRDAGIGSPCTRADMEALGFFVCDADLEAELIRALGIDGVERVLAEQGELRAFRTFQNQPAQRSRPVEAQLHRFFGSFGGRKSRYARALLEALGAQSAPRPLTRLLDYTARQRSSDR